MTTKITVKEFDDIRTKNLLLNFDRYNEETIGRLFGSPIAFEELLNLKYEESQSPELKLIWRFRSAHDNPVIFWNALDPVNAKLLMQYSGLSDMTHLLHFFVWLINHKKINGYRPTQSIVEAFYNDPNANRDVLVKQYNTEIDSRVVYGELREIAAKLEALLERHEFPSNQNNILVKIVEELGEFN